MEINARHSVWFMVSLGLVHRKGWNDWKWMEVNWRQHLVLTTYSSTNLCVCECVSGCVCAWVCTGRMGAEPGEQTASCLFQFGASRWEVIFIRLGAAPHICHCRCLMNPEPGRAVASLILQRQGEPSRPGCLVPSLLLGPEEPVLPWEAVGLYHVSWGDKLRPHLWQVRYLLQLKVKHLVLTPPLKENIRCSGRRKPSRNWLV